MKVINRDKYVELQYVFMEWMHGVTIPVEEYEELKKHIIKEFLEKIYLQAIAEEPEDVMEFLEQVEEELEGNQ